ncbi:hypothetical protein AB0I54_47325 [Streptomyces sp. NPDC050625]
MDATLAQTAYVGQESLGASGAVGADEEIGAVAVGVGSAAWGRAASRTVM